MPLCEIIYVRQENENGWKWRPIEPRAAAEASEEIYELYYECVTAARTNGYEPNQKCL